MAYIINSLRNFVKWSFYDSKDGADHREKTQTGVMNMVYERRWLAVTAVGLSLFLSALDATIVALALPSFAQHFQLSASLVSVVILSYAIPLTILILPSGDLISRFNTLPIFLVAVLGFGLGSVICGLASSFSILILGRVIQGCFGAVIATQGIAVAAAVVS